jgi:hypothetical protein
LAEAGLGVTLDMLDDAAPAGLLFFTGLANETQYK